MSAPGRCRAGDGGLELTRDARGIARHLMDCPSCYGRLDAYRDESDGLLRIREPKRERAGRLLDHVLAAAHRDGEQELADLLFEMARACIKLAPETTTPIRFVREPRPYRNLARESKVLGERLRSAGALQPPDLREFAPSDAEALSAAELCLDLLGQLETGPSERCRFLRGVVLVQRGALEEGVSVYEALVESGSPRVRAVAEVSLLPAWNALGRHDDVVALAHRLLQLGEDRNVLFCLAAAYAWLGEAERVIEVAHRYSRVERGETDPHFWDQLVEDEAAWFSEKTGLPRSEIRRAFLGRTEVSPQ